MECGLEVDRNQLSVATSAKTLGKESRRSASRSVQFAVLYTVTASGWAGI